MNEINKYNNDIIYKQINNINKIIEKIEENKSVYLKPTIIQIAVGIDWCNKYKLPLNKKYN